MAVTDRYESPARISIYTSGSGGEVIDLSMARSARQPKSPSFEDLPEMTIADWQPQAPVDEPGVGQIETTIVDIDDETKNGSRFVFRKVVPYEQDDELSVDMTTPLYTRVNGFNTYVALKLAQRRKQSRIVGANQTHHHTLQHDAKATLSILDYDDSQRDRHPDSAQGQTSAPGESFMAGYSMGCMKLFAMLGIAPEMGRDVRFFSGIDPCLANKVRYRTALKNAPAIVKYLGGEAVDLSSSVLEDARKSPFETARWVGHVASTVSPTLKFGRLGLDKWQTLATGTSPLLSGVPADAAGIVHFFDGSRYNDDEVYEQSLQDRAGIKLIREPGGHLAAACREAVRNWADETVDAIELLRNGADPRLIANQVNRPLVFKAA